MAPQGVGVVAVDLLGVVAHELDPFHGGPSSTENRSGRTAGNLIGLHYPIYVPFPRQSTGAVQGDNHLGGFGPRRFMASNQFQPESSGLARLKRMLLAWEMAIAWGTSNHRDTCK
jgi:hypothetical protein